MRFRRDLWISGRLTVAKGFGDREERTILGLITKARLKHGWGNKGFSPLLSAPAFSAFSATPLVQYQLSLWALTRLPQETREERSRTGSGPGGSRAGSLTRRRSQARGLGSRLGNAGVPREALQVRLWPRRRWRARSSPNSVVCPQTASPTPHHHHQPRRISFWLFWTSGPAGVPLSLR